MKRLALSALGVAATLLGAYLLYRLFRRTDFNAAFAALAEVPLHTVLLGCLLGLGSFACIAVQEFLATRYAGSKLRPGQVAVISTAAIGIGHCIGLAFLSSGAVRLRLYTRAGLGMVAVGEIIAFCAVSVTLGFLTIGGLVLMLQGQRLADLVSLPAGLAHAAGAVAWALMLAYIAACRLWRRDFRFRKLHFRLPSMGTAMLQVLASSGNILCIAGVLWVSLDAYIGTSYGNAVFLQVGADLAALLTHVPGGWGVLEYIVVESFGKDEAITGVLLFRGLYYLAPLAIGLLLFLLDELFSPRGEANEAAASQDSRQEPGAREVPTA